jgi:hypothetical protein
LFTANSFFHSTSPKTIAIDSQASSSLYANTQLRAHRRAEKKRKEQKKAVNKYFSKFPITLPHTKVQQKRPCDQNMFQIRTCVVLGAYPI